MTLVSQKTAKLWFDTSVGAHYSEVHNDALCFNLRVYVLLLSLLHHAGVSLERSSTSSSNPHPQRI
jgi:hypothetical protein